jgi:hypothetical protein
METTLKIDTPTIERDYFPSIFVNKDNTIVILADGKTSEKTQFKRLPKRSVLNLKIVQGEI